MFTFCLWSIAVTLFFVICKGAALVSVEDPSEQDFIASNVKVYQDSQSSFWIGLYKTHSGTVTFCHKHWIGSNQVTEYWLCIHQVGTATSGKSNAMCFLHDNRLIDSNNFLYVIYLVSPCFASCILLIFHNENIVCSVMFWVIQYTFCKLQVHKILFCSHERRIIEYQKWNGAQCMWYRKDLTGEKYLFFLQESYSGWIKLSWITLTWNIINLMIWTLWQFKQKMGNGEQPSKEAAEVIFAKPPKVRAT